MSTIINNYPVFEDSQVLTSGQLNQMIKYLDQQNRLTRVSLIGMGIVCGMKISCETGDGLKKLIISKGLGVTSEGFLITIGTCETTRYRVYEKPDSVSYPPFEHDDLVIHELLTATALTDPEVEVFDLVDDDFLDNKVVILYLECFDKDLKSCLGKSCDELGIDRIFTLRKLLIDKTQLEEIVLPDLNGGMADASFPDKVLLPQMIWKRPLFHSDTDTYYKLCLKYIDIITSGQFLPTLSKTYDVYEPVLAEIYGSNPFVSSTITSKVNDIIAYLQAFIIMEQPLYGIQYFYDFIKDLTLAYEEFRATAFELTSICCPDMDRFPKHLMLGAACPELDDICIEQEFKNVFVSSPALSSQEHLLSKMQFLHRRLVLLLESFDLQRLKEPEQWPLKITPSCEKKGLLSERTIPIYYDSKMESQFDNLSTLENTWHFEDYRKCYPSEFPEQLSYDNHEFVDVIEHPVTTPLGFDLDQFNFLRIEGILGKNVLRVKEQLDQAKALWNLSFDVKAIHFGELLENRPSPDCLASDLQTDYSIWRHKLLLILNNLVKTSRTVEAAVINRNAIISSVSTANIKKSTLGKTVGTVENSARSSESFAGMEAVISDNLLDIQQLTGGMLNASGELDINQITKRVFKADINIANVTNDASSKKSASFASEEDNIIKSLFNQLNDCMLGLINAMPEDLRDFDMREWLDKYKCVLRVYINTMKYIASRANSNLSMVVILVVLLVMCYIFDLLKFFSIHPYITIRTLYDTLQERIDQLGESLRFQNFTGNYPGIDHKAGVAPGHTFILVHQAPQEFPEREESKFRDLILAIKNREKVIVKEGRNRFNEILTENKLFGKSIKAVLDKKADPKVLQEVAKEMEGMIVADFTLPFICCDDCSNLPHTPLPLDPLVAPVCGVVGYSDAKLQSYRVFKKQLLNNLYDPAVYKISVKEETNFGKTELRESIYHPDPDKKSQVLFYEVDVEKINQEKEVNPAYIFIDELEYEVRDSTNDELVGSDTISIFIPVVREEQGLAKGNVTFVDEKGNANPIPGAEVVVEETDLKEVTNKAGAYEMLAVPTGENVFIASHPNFNGAQKTVVISGGENIVDFQLTPKTSVGALVGRVLRVADGVTAPASGAVVNLKGTNFSANTNLEGKFTIRNIPPAEYDVVTTLNGFNSVEQKMKIEPGQNSMEITLTSGKGVTGSISGIVEGIGSEGKRSPLQDVKIDVFSNKQVVGKNAKPKYTSKTNAKGSFSMSNVAAGDYTVKAILNGFSIGEKPAAVIANGQSSISFVLEKTKELAVKYDRILDAMNVKAGSKDANKIKSYYAANMEYYKLRMLKVEETSGGKKITPLTNASKAIREFSDTENINIVKLNNEYNSNRNELMKGWASSTGEEKEVYAESINALTMAYLDRLAIAQPDKLSDTSKDVLSETGDLFNSNKDLDMKDSIELWSEDSKGYVTEDFRADVKRFMKLK